MKNKKIVLSVLAVATIASSCSVTKRTYSDGYHVEWHHRAQKTEKTTTSQKAADPTEEIIKEENQELVLASESPLNHREDHTPPAKDIESIPLKENKRPIADRSNAMQYHPAPFVKNSLQHITKQVVKVKENMMINKQYKIVLKNLYQLLLS